MTDAVHRGRAAPPVSACVRVRVPDAQVAAALDAVREHAHLPARRLGRGYASLATPDGTLSFENLDVLTLATWRIRRRVRGRIAFPWRLAADLPREGDDARTVDTTVRALLASMRALVERHMSPESLDLGSREDVLDAHRTAAGAAVSAHIGWTSRTFVQHRSEWAPASIDPADRDVDPWETEETMHALVADIENGMPLHAHALAHHTAKPKRGVSFDVSLHGLVEQVRRIDAVEAMRVIGRIRGESAACA